MGSKMHADLPVCERCCFCFPLRYGLITWGYLRLVIAIPLLVGISLSFHRMLRMAINEQDITYKWYTLLSGFVLVLTLTDIVLNSIFIVGGHKKHLKLLRAFYIYSFILWLLTGFIGLALTIYTMHRFRLGDMSMFHTWVLLVDVSTFFTQLMIQAYALLLLRSEIIKLRNKCQFRFTNNVDISECSMKCEEEIVDGEDKPEDICEKGICRSKETSELFGRVT